MLYSAVLNCIKENPKIISFTIASKLGYSEQFVLDEIEDLEESGKITRSQYGECVVK